MAITNYSELQTAIANWLHRADLTARIPEFIALREAELNSTAFLRDNEIDTPLTATLGNPYINLPSDYESPVALWLEVFTPTRRKLVFKPPADLPYRPIQTYPTYWTINDARIKLDRDANAALPLTLRYHRRFALSLTTTTNALLTRYPNVYLYGALLEAAPFIRDDARLATWQDRYDRAWEAMQEAEDKSKDRVGLGVDAGILPQVSVFNIFEGT